MEKRFKTIYMVGIGGIGMSGLAFILKEMGHAVSGSDVLENSITKKLKARGIVVRLGHAGSDFTGVNLVVFSSSIRKDNPELRRARKIGITTIPRIELLKMVMDGYKKRIGILGTHGKTTITAMTSLVLEKAGAQPTVLIGGESVHFGGNAKLGGKDVIVAEVDESDGHFPIVNATHIIMPNLENEHAEHYKDESHMVLTFKRFLKTQSKKSFFIYRIEDRNLRSLAGARKTCLRSFGYSEEALTYATDLRVEPALTRFKCFSDGKRLGEFTLSVPGVHNVTNALAAISAGVSLGIDVKTIKSSIGSYRSVKRRFELIGSIRGARIIEDYAHHPTEIRATIQAACSTKPRRIISVFQPHRYSRTRAFRKEFSTSFAGSDEVILTDVYPASEERLKGGDVESIYDIMFKDGSFPVRLMKKEKIPGYLSKKVKVGDVVLILGAGDIGRMGREFVKGIKQ